MAMTNAERQKRFRERTLAKARANENELIDELREIFVKDWKRDCRASPLSAGNIKDKELWLVEKVMSGRLFTTTGVKVSKLLYRMLTGKEKKDVPDSLNKLKGCWSGDKATGVKPAKAISDQNAS